MVERPTVAADAETQPGPHSGAALKLAEGYKVLAEALWDNTETYNRAVDLSYRRGWDS